MRTPPAEADRFVAIFSDIEVGAGGPSDDFPQTAWLAEELLAIAALRRPGLDVHLVFNGDTFDLLKTATPDGLYPSHISASIALAKLDRILAAHGPFLDAVRAAVDGGCHVHFVVGNHDLELVFPQLQDRLAERLGSVRFEGFSLRLGDAHIEHGSQQDALFLVDPQDLFVELDGETILKQPWGAVALLDVAMPLQPVLYHLDRLKPRERVLELLPEVRELLLDAYWHYWTKQYLSEWLSGSDPLKKLDWRRFREIVYRFASDDAEVSPEADWSKRLASDKHLRLVCLGHEHQVRLESWGNQKVLRAGALRQEFMVEDDGVRQVPMPKGWIELWQSGGRTLQSQQIERACPPLPPGYAPDTVYDVLGAVRRARRTIARQQAAREAHERRYVWPWSR